MPLKDIETSGIQERKCDLCGTRMLITSKTPRKIHYACSSRVCDRRYFIWHGQRQRGFTDPGVTSNKAYETKLHALLALESLGQASGRQIATRTGLPLGKVQAVLQRLKNSKTQLTERLGVVPRFPSGAESVFDLSEQGKHWLALARYHGTSPKTPGTTFIKVKWQRMRSTLRCLPLRSWIPRRRLQAKLAPNSVSGQKAWLHSRNTERSLQVFCKMEASQESGGTSSYIRGRGQIDLYENTLHPRLSILGVSMRRCGA